ncbi:uncharacterized protein LOC108933126 [Scleropages formosus]|uniref:PHD-type domain-containing protein n=1 Tax=Scleropages formosus TaxID=113540 RepID=A0A8C9QYR3_SCLFO|nr:PHD finger protein 11 [Scleropages formosus]XP_018605473.1 PHD finger protein 11 [Scleropages formosus]
METLPTIVCGFCHESEESKITGPILKKNSVVAHENCLFFSSGIYNKNTPDTDDLEGFEEQDVIQEMKRGKFLKCHKCKKSGATVGCEVKKCKRSYHYSCAIHDKAQRVENIKKGVFKLYCELHRQSPTREINFKNSTAEQSTKTGNSDRAQDLEIPAKRRRQHTLQGHTRKVRRSILYSDDSSSSDGHEQYDCEQAPLENDLEEKACSVTKQIVKADKTSTYTDEAQPSTSANLSLAYSENQDETDIDSDQGSQSLLVPFNIKKVETLAPSPPAPDISPCSSSARPVSLGSHFWSKCHEAGCLESIFSTFISSMISLSEKILNKQASNEECDLYFKVLIASGVLPDIITRKEQDLKEKMSSLEKEREALQTALSVISSVSKTSAFPVSHQSGEHRSSEGCSRCQNGTSTPNNPS